MTPRLTKAGFERWLRGKEPSEWVGGRMSVSACPLACYLGAAGMPGPRVNGIDYFAGGRRVGKLPAWVREFVAVVDKPRSAFFVTAAEALALLHRGAP